MNCLKSYIYKVIGEVGRSNVNICRRTHNLSVIKTLLLNLKLFPLKTAIKLPILVGKRVKLRNIGKIRIDCEIKPFMISIGNFYIPEWQNYKDTTTIIDNKGCITIKGPVRLYAGCKINVASDAKLSFAGYNIIGYNSKIICWNKIEIGVNSGCSWDCQIFDTDFHYVKDEVGNSLLKPSTFVKIADNVFIGNNVSILKGTKIPNKSLVSSLSRVSGVFTKEGEGLLIAGNPAKVVDKGYCIMIKNFQEVDTL